MIGPMEINTRESGKIITGMEKDFLFNKVVINMMECGKMI
jgi:hypothetical protein